MDATTGAGAPGNPFSQAPLIYTHGHRNLQGLALRPGTSQMWSVEHGPRVDDEINLLAAGGNYGWDPARLDENMKISYNQDDSPMTDLVKFPSAIEAKWSSGSPTVATSGAIFLEGEQWGQWEGRLAVATLANKSLRIFEFDADGGLVSHVVPPELYKTYGRLRTPMLGPDGALYISTDTTADTNSDKILRVTPQQAPEFPAGATTQEVLWNATPSTVIATIKASDYNYDTLTYTLGGPGAASFDIDSATGQLKTRAALDPEIQDSYTVIVIATDSFNLSDEITVTITVTTAPPVITSVGPFAVAEGSTVVAALAATDDYTLSAGLAWSIPSGAAGGADADKFTLSTTGALAFAAAKDYENPDDADAGRTYEVNVQVTDGDNPVTADLLVTLENVLELAAAITGPSSSHYAENGASRVATYTASSTEDNGEVVWTLSGDDAGLFSIDGGVLRFLSLPDFETPSDTDMDRVYSVTVTASDRAAVPTTRTSDVTITVTNQEETGTLSLNSLQPKLGEALTATLADPDGEATSVTWTWERSSGRSEWRVINGAASANYMPVAADAGHYLRAQASYTGGQSAQVVAPNVVLAHSLSQLAVTGATRAMYPAFDAETLHYAAGCSGSLGLTLETEENDVRVAVNGTQAATGERFEVNGLDGQSDVSISLTGSSGASTAYVIHCIDDETFPIIKVTRGADAEGVIEDLIMFPRVFLLNGTRRGYLIMIDNNGVPRLRKKVNDRASIYFRAFSDGVNPHARYGFGSGSKLVVLDQYFEEVADDIQVVSPLTVTDVHDFMIQPNGDYVLLAYEPAQRDFSFLAEYGVDPAGNAYGSQSSTDDAAIQIRTSGGSEKFTWNSWDHMAIEDCVAHRFPRDYAHVVSLDWAGGDIVASFHGCGKILRIDVDTGECGLAGWTEQSQPGGVGSSNGQRERPRRGAGPADVRQRPRPADSAVTTRRKFYPTVTCSCSTTAPPASSIRVRTRSCGR